MDKFLYAIHEITPNDITILTQDGGIATIHKVEDEDRYLTTYYQNRCDATFDDEMWDALSEGKVYHKDWYNKKEIDEDMIIDALEWLNVVCHDFEKVEFNFLTNQITRE